MVGTRVSHLEVQKTMLFGSSSKSTGVFHPLKRISATSLLKNAFFFLIKGAVFFFPWKRFCTLTCSNLQKFVFLFFPRAVFFFRVDFLKFFSKNVQVSWSKAHHPIKSLEPEKIYESEKENTPILLTHSIVSENHTKIIFSKNKENTVKVNPRRLVKFFSSESS